MPSLDLSKPVDEVFQKSKDGARFIFLGTENAAAPTSHARRKIRRTMRGPAPKLWGTLGMADNSAPQWTGQIWYSGKGNHRSLKKESYGATCEEIDHIKAAFKNSAG